MKFKHGTRRRALEYEKDWAQRWKKDGTFKKSVENRPKDDSYVFYDGPPFITGVPHHGTLLSSIVKDAVPRYWTMKGKRVERRWGWDCHGLPAENFVEKQLGIVDRRQIVVGKNSAKDSLKFKPELAELIKRGKKTTTFRYHAKNLKVGDTAELFIRHDASSVDRFGYARITNVTQMPLRDLPLNEYNSKEEQLASYRGYWGKEVALDSMFAVYDFEYLGESLVQAPLDKDGNELPTISLETYIEKARESMVANSATWEGVIDRIGRWVDFKGAYRTMDKDFMESVWWAFKNLYDAGKIYEGEKVLMYDTKFATPVSKAEVTMDNDAYQTVTDPSVFVKFKLKNDVAKSELPRVLFVCQANLGRSQIARGFYNKYTNTDSADSAGVFVDTKFYPGALSLDKVTNERGKPLGSVVVMQEKDIDIAFAKRAQLTPELVEKYDIVVDLMKDDEERPEWFSSKHVEHWNIDDIGVGQSDIRKTRDTIETKVHELANRYATIDAKSVSLLAWTTTPWTLPANLMLAVNPEMTYCEVLVGGEKLIIAEEALERVLKDEKNKPLEYEVLRTFPGSELVGKSYEPLDTGSTWPTDEKTRGKIHKVYAADFVSHESGTGIVHVAPAYGEDDFELAKSMGVAPFHVIDDNGYYTDTNYKGLEVWDNNKFIAKDLKEKGIVWKIEYIRHEYPFNPRSKQRIMYRAIPSWFFDIQGSKPLMLEQNENINWFPPHLKHGRFAKNIEQAPDWNLSRDRFWATAMPVWKGDKGTVKVIGSYAELKELSGVELEDYHRPWVDDIEFDLMLDGKPVANSKEITTDRLTIRPSIIEDAQDIFANFTQRVATYMSPQPFKSVDEVKKWLTTVIKEVESGKNFQVTILDKNTGEFIGMGGVHELHTRTPEFGIWTKESVWGSGMGHEAVEALNEWAQKNLDFDYIKYPVIPENKPSRSIAESLGGKLEDEYDDKDSLGNPIKLIEYRVYPDGNRKYIEHFTRIDKVLDCWFESGSMPFAQLHYPFENQEKFEQNYPAEFITEYVPQVRAWFYYVHSINTNLAGLGAFGEDSNKIHKNAFKNVIVTGTLAGNDGRKMSKSLGNFTDPNVLMDKFSADSLRFLLLSSPLLNSEDFALHDKDVGDVARKFGMVWNMYDFFTMYAEVDGWEFDSKKPFTLNPDNLTNPLDKWIVSRLHQLNEEVTRNMDGYNIPDALSPVLPFLDDASNWYVRRSRRRFWKSEDDGDKNDAYRTLHYVLLKLSVILAPFTPFLAEELYHNLGGGNESVHLLDWPTNYTVDEKVVSDMTRTRELINTGLGLRMKKDEHQDSIKVRQPLQFASYAGEKLDDYYEQIMIEELNVKEIHHIDSLNEHVENYDEVHGVIDPEAWLEISKKVTPELKREGLMREVIRFVQSARKNAGLNVDDRIVLSLIVKPGEADDLGKAIEEHSETIAHEALAVKFADVQDGYDETVKIEGMELRIGLKKL